jgi:nitrogen fixation NifU-like protein
MADNRDNPPLNSLYQQVIIEHFKRPRNKGALEDADVRAHLNNPTCGDEVLLMLKLDGERIAAAKFVGEGCSISQSSISMMTQLVVGKTREEAEELARKFTALMHGDSEVARDKSLGDLRALKDVSKFPVRVKCALLGWNALEEALRSRAADQVG